MINKVEIKKIIQNVSKNPEQYKKRLSKLDKLLREEKKELVHLITVLNVSPKRIYDMMIESEAISGIAYITFYKWIKNNSAEVLEQAENNDVNEAAIEQQIVIDSREKFYGFDMNNDPDVVTNPVPQLHEISKEYIFNIFKNDTSLNNEKIVYILLYEVSASGNNKFKDIWHFMLMQNGENIQQYYDRLQDVTNSHGKYSFGITNATASISDIAFTCGCDMYKIIRRTI
ncbi:hypothetical protein [Sulfuricurvum sp.]|uniref:hypothetical protein n=1 Tax=Sulfuricurvum sp. TaxID=2025608 RepID=UPI0026318B81|nr:hypothetical protein [Sulfuricurvum sp.]MDD2782318.1 hypothetical protein [Sulfuricurvum sp.]